MVAGNWERPSLYKIGSTKTWNPEFGNGNGNGNGNRNRIRNQISMIAFRIAWFSTIQREFKLVFLAVPFNCVCVESADVWSCAPENSF